MENKMWTYIDEQKDVLTNILNQEEKILSSLPDAFINKKEIIITASGSSLNAAMLVKTMLEKEIGCLIQVETPFQLRYYSPLLHLPHKHKLLIVLSQTGKSIGTLECYKSLKITIFLQLPLQQIIRVQLPFKLIHISICHVVKNLLVQKQKDLLPQS